MRALGAPSGRESPSARTGPGEPGVHGAGARRGVAEQGRKPRAQGHERGQVAGSWGSAPGRPPCPRAAGRPVGGGSDPGAPASTPPPGLTPAFCLQASVRKKKGKGPPLSVRSPAHAPRGRKPCGRRRGVSSVRWPRRVSPCAGPCGGSSRGTRPLSVCSVCFACPVCGPIVVCITPSPAVSASSWLRPGAPRSATGPPPPRVRLLARGAPVHGCRAGPDHRPPLP